MKRAHSRETRTSRTIPVIVMQRSDRTHEEEKHG
jgi:hypothetical protein